MKKIRSSQAAILFTDLSKTQLFPVRIVTNTTQTSSSFQVLPLMAKTFKLVHTWPAIYS